MDIRVHNFGSICVLEGSSAPGSQWLQDHLPQESQQWRSGGYVVEPRYVADILEGAQADGFSVH